MTGSGRKEVTWWTWENVEKVRKGTLCIDVLEAEERRQVDWSRKT